MESQKKFVSDDSYHELRRMLMYGQIPPGTRLAEVEWSQRFNIHRPALREAMGLLVHEGLLVRGARGGFFVPILERRDFQEIREARIVVESGAIRLIQQAELDAETLRPLDELCQTMEHLLDAGIVLGFVEADYRFHETLVRLTGNGRLIRMYNHTALPLLMDQLPSPDLLRRGGPKTVAEHREIHQYLLDRRYGDAVSVLEAHLNTSHCESLTNRV